MREENASNHKLPEGAATVRAYQDQGRTLCDSGVEVHAYCLDRIAIFVLRKLDSCEFGSEADEVAKPSHPDPSVIISAGIMQQIAYIEALSEPRGS